MNTQHGSCLCGAAAYATDGLDSAIEHCHCRTCRKAHAAVFASNARVQRERFRWLRGESQLRAFESSPGKNRWFCTNCGTHLIAERPTQPHVILRVATLDDDPGRRAVMHIWTSHDAAWLTDEPGVKAWPEFPRES